MKRKWMIRSAAVLAAAFFACALYAYGSYSPGAPTYLSQGAAAIKLVSRLRSWPEHDALYPGGTDGYVFEAQAGDGALLYYGAKHSSDPKHPQRLDIEQRWEAFEPTVALCEGRSRGFMIGTLFEPFTGLPEPVLVHRLARRDDVALFSLEPAYEDEVAGLLERWPPELVAMYFTLRVYVGESGGQDRPSLAADLLAKRTDVEGLRNVITSVEQLDEVWKKHFRDLPTWRTLKAEPKKRFFQEIGDASREIRGEHMVRTLVDLVRKGERVFAVVGCSHVIRQELMIRDALGASPQPAQSGQ